MEVVEMESHPDANFEGSEDAWVEELNKLSTRVGAKEIYVRVSWPGGELNATGFQPQVNERQIQILLQPREPSGNAGAFLQISLPDEDAGGGFYERFLGDSGEVCISMTYLVCGMSHSQESTLWLASNPELLNLASGELRKM
jgi:hypothetical protein